MYKLIAFDLDGTLTEHRTTIDEENLKVLQSIQEKYQTVIVGAGTCERILRQLNYFPINIIGNYGMQISVLKNGVRKKYKEFYSIDKCEVRQAVQKIREKTGYTEYVGDSVEFHESGIITLPLLGTNADIKEKIKFDPYKHKRKAIYSIVKKEFPKYTVVIGGSSSFDIMPKSYNKYKSLMRYAKSQDINIEQIVYVGDDFSEGGNDESIFKSPIKCVEIVDYRELREKLSFLL